MEKVRAGSLPTAADERQSRAVGPSLTRRQLMAGAGQAALLVMVPIGCTPAANTPFADGTFWDDGSGWTT